MHILPPPYIPYFKFFKDDVIAVLSYDGINPYLFDIVLDY